VGSGIPFSMEIIMSIAQTIALNWRAITAFVMAAIQLGTATGLLPVETEAQAQTLIASAGGVIAIIAGGSYVQNISSQKQVTAQVAAVASAANASAEASRAVVSAAVAQPTSALVQTAMENAPNIRAAADAVARVQEAAAGR